MWVNRLGRSPKMSDVSELLRSFTKNKRPWASCSGRSPTISELVNRSFFWANHSFAHFFAKNERFAQKSDERIPSPVWTILSVYSIWAIPSICASWAISSMYPCCSITSNVQCSTEQWQQFSINYNMYESCMICHIWYKKDSPSSCLWICLQLDEMIILHFFSRLSL